MEAWMVQLITGIIITAFFGAISFFIKKLITDINLKLDQVLANQHSQDIKMTAIKKDVDLALLETEAIKNRLYEVELRMNSLEIQVAKL